MDTTQVLNHILSCDGTNVCLKHKWYLFPTHMCEKKHDGKRENVLVPDNKCLEVIQIF